MDVAEVFKLVNKGIVSEKDFREEVGGIFLRDRGRRAFTQEFESRLGTTIKLGGRHFSYARVIRLELYKIEKHFMEEKEYPS